VCDTQDEASRDFVFRAISSGANAKKWKSMFWYGKLVYDGIKGPASYFLEKHGTNMCIYICMIYTYDGIKDPASYFLEQHGENACACV